MTIRPTIAIALALLPGAIAHADEAPAGRVTGNVALTSDYLFRGLTQSWGHPAIQGGADYADVGSFAAGLWASSISGRSYPGGAMELDLYASYGREATSGHPWPHFQQEQ